MSNYQFLMTISISDLVEFEDDFIDACYEKESFKQLRESVDVSIPTVKMYEEYLEAPVDSGDVYLYASKEESLNYILLDLYRDPYDQLDLIRLGISTIEEKYKRVKELARRVYDQSGLNINYLEGQFILKEMKDRARSGLN
ncbi:hypothetical protein M3231_10990 [Neobacillus mesonae]|nr:hypothetical protein [Neobacillus mesonae]